jgi:hypothetical protein
MRNRGLKIAVDLFAGWFIASLRRVINLPKSASIRLLIVAHARSKGGASTGFLELYQSEI